MDLYCLLQDSAGLVAAGTVNAWLNLVLCDRSELCIIRCGNGLERGSEGSIYLCSHELNSKKALQTNKTKTIEGPFNCRWFEQ